MSDLYKLLANNKPIKCDICEGRMLYVASGMYKCKLCGHEVLDDYGKIKEFLENYGPMPSVMIARATGVQPDVIEMLLKTGKVEIPEGSNYYLKCEKCGCSIRYGRFCLSCANGLAGDIKTTMRDDIGERPRQELTSERSGKMHFLRRR